SCSACRSAVLRDGPALRQRTRDCSLSFVCVLVLLSPAQGSSGRRAVLTGNHEQAHAGVTATIFCPQEKMDLARCDLALRDRDHPDSLDLFWLPREQSAFARVVRPR